MVKSFDEEVSRVKENGQANFGKDPLAGSRMPEESVMVPTISVLIR